MSRSKYHFNLSFYAEASAGKGSRAGVCLRARVSGLEAALKQPGPPADQPALGGDKEWERRLLSTQSDTFTNPRWDPDPTGPRQYTSHPETQEHPKSHTYAAYARRSRSYAHTPITPRARYNHFDPPKNIDYRLTLKHHNLFNQSLSECTHN